MRESHEASPEQFTAKKCMKTVVFRIQILDLSVLSTSDLYKV